MSHHLVRFGTTDLPAYNGRHSWNGGGSAPTLYAMPDGVVFDPLGSKRTPRGVRRAQAKGMIIASDAAGFEAQVNALLALDGVRDKLVRRSVTGFETWCWARMEAPDPERLYTQRFFMEVPLDWQLESPWYAMNEVVLTFRDLYDADFSDLPRTGAASPPPGSVLPITVRHPGNLPTYGVRFEVDTGNANITQVRVNNTTAGYEFIANHAIPSGQTLVVDAGRSSVLLGGANAYTNAFVRPATKVRWMELMNGDNLFNILLSGTNIDDSTELRIRFYPTYV